MTQDELLKVISERFTAATLAATLDMLSALLNKQIATAKISIADVAANSAMQQAEQIRQAAQAEANAADVAFATLVAAQAAQ
jgi:hypothetical protein